MINQQNQRCCRTTEGAEKIEKQLCGKKIVAVRYMTPEEMNQVIGLINYLFIDDGTHCYV